MEKGKFETNPKIKAKLEKKKTMKTDSKLKNKNHKQKAKNWKQQRKSPFETKTEERSMIRREYGQLTSKASKDTLTEKVAKCLSIMGEKISKYAYKRDGSRILQACLKRGNAEQIEQIKFALKPDFYTMMKDKYGRFLCKKLYSSAFSEVEKKAVVDHICGKMEKYITHLNAMELIEEIYITAKPAVKEQLFEAVFGQLLKFIKDEDSTDMQKAMEERPLIKQKIEYKLEKQIHHFVSKGLIRHTFIQRIFLYYAKKATPEQMEKLIEETKDNYLALLESRDGVFAACILFTAASAKNRKQMLKLLKTENENLVDNMIGKNLGTVFLLKVLLSMDDTKLSCKLIVDRALDLIGDYIQDSAYVRFLSGLCADNLKSYYPNEDYEILTYTANSSSKKDQTQRRNEVLGHLMEGLQDCVSTVLLPQIEVSSKLVPLLVEICTYIVQGHFSQHEKLLITILEFVLSHLENEKSLRILTSTVKKEIAFVTENKGKKYEFCEKFISLLKPHLFDLLKTKGIFVIIKLLECPSLKKLLISDVLKHKAKLEELLKASEHKKGIEILLSFLQS